MVWYQENLEEKMIQISPRIIIDERLISEEFVRASGPGGQHVNKVSSAVQLKFDIANWKPDDPELKVRLLKIAGNRVIYNREKLLSFFF